MRRVRTNVTVDAALLAEAKAHGVSLSGALEAGRRELLRSVRRAAFLAENAAGYDAARGRFETDGLPFDAERRF
jgi:post-segregation antitoxin (ccd killing protein)